ncbi:MAG: sulfate adenylyltransferase subunit CysN [Terracidiphilus sp.]
MSALSTPVFSIDEFLQQEGEKDLLRFSTAGSVDDGKSTLIGRLLYDTQSVYEDQVRAIEGKGTTAPGQIDFALLTDGLRAEREQGITIDVAYRYFSTAKRKFIIADTPGHEQYTRNMATGASTADAAVVLIDATKGVLPQSRRHAYIASLLRVRNVIVAVNKMDLVDFGEAVFRAIEDDFRIVLDQIAADTGTGVESTFVPVSALAGDNVVHCSRAMRWYKGPSLLELLESLPSSLDTRNEPFRFPVQRVLRPDSTFRGFAGQIASGTVRAGDSITVLPSGRSAVVERIVTFDGDLTEAQAPLSVTLVLDRELDISRGDLIASEAATATIAKNVKASLVWMDQRPLALDRRYLLKHTSQTVPAFVTSIQHHTNISTLAHEPAETLEMNGIGIVSVNLVRPIAIDLYRDNRSTGAFILIDPEANSTVAAGMVISASEHAVIGPNIATSSMARVTAEERAARWGHRGGVLELHGSEQLIDSIERSLFHLGAITLRIENSGPLVAFHAQSVDAVLEAAVRSGLIVLLTDSTGDYTFTARAAGHEISLDVEDTHSAIVAVHRLLAQAGILNSMGKADVQ